jgi:integrase
VAAGGEPIRGHGQTLRASDGRSDMAIGLAGEPAGGHTCGVGEWQVARRRELTELAREFAQDSRADSTWRVYNARWARFVAWCADQGEPALPADPVTVCRFMADLAPRWRPAIPTDDDEAIVAGQVLVRPGLRPDTVAGYLAAISIAHQGASTPQDLAGDRLATATATATELDQDLDRILTDADLAGPNPATLAGVATPASGPAGPAAEAIRNPARHDLVLRVLVGIRRQPTVRPVRRRDALRTEDMDAILTCLDPAEHLADARDAALLLIGWNAGLRTDDLARLDITDLVVVPNEGLVVHLRRSKTDPTGVGATLGITAADHPGDPLDAIAAWTRWRNRLAAHGLHTGPAWRPVDRYGRRPRATRMTTKAINTIIARRAAGAGLHGDHGGHSLRRGFATTAIAAGADRHRVQTHGRWRSPASMTPYIDEAELFDADNPTRYLRRRPDHRGGPREAPSAEGLR